MGWIKCSDKYPEDMTDVLVTDGWEVKIMWWYDGKWNSWASRLALDSDSITHWKPLPNPPEGE